MLQVLSAEPGLLPAEGKIAFLHARPHQGLSKLRDRVVCHNDFKPTADLLEAAGFKNEKKIEGKYPLVLLLPERQKLQTLADMALAFDLLEEGGVLLVGLHNDWGAKRYEKLLNEVAGGKEGTLSKFHCRAFWTRKTAKLNAGMIEEWRRQGDWQKVADGRYWSRPGLFSWDKVDKGSLYLTEHLPSQMNGRVADLGAGWGFLSEVLLRNRPEIQGLDLYEADRVGLEACRRNVEAARGDKRVAYHWVDAVAGIADKKFDYVVCNPPFHEDRSPDPELGVLFVAAALKALKNEGELWLVANRHLPYEGVMGGLFAESMLVAQDGSYKVLRGVKRAPAVARGDED